MVVEALVLPDAARVTTRIATHAILASQQCTQMPQNGDERPFPPICVHFCVPTAVRATGASGGSWNSVHCHSAVNVRGWNVQARVAVSPTRGRTLRGEWQCVSHCQMASSVPKRYAQARVAVPPTRGRTLGVEWQCSLHCQMASNVPKRYARGRVAVRSVRSRVSGSIVCTATRR